jgi:hypothetical protein
VSSPSRTQLRVGRSITLLGITQSGLDVLVAKTLADRRQAHPVLDECGRVTVAKLVQRALDTSFGAVGRSARLDRLVAQPLPLPFLSMRNSGPYRACVSFK